MSEPRHAFLKIMDTKIGQMFAVADEQLLYLLDFYSEKKYQKRLNQLQNQGFSFYSEFSAPLRSLQDQLHAYFEGSLTEFNIPYSLVGTPFQKAVWTSLCQIPYGQTKSYHAQALSLEKPNSYRAVGNANGANPLAIVIPCHRVIAKDGSLGGYAGGLTTKQWLLEHEARVTSEIQNEN